MKIYRAVIEDNKDPEFLGRYRVRIFGIVNGDKGGYETANTAELPWAECVGPTAFGLIGQTGVSSIMHQGTWVYVVLQDDNPNFPIILGTVAGVAAMDQDGFGDPDGTFPQQPGLDLGFISGEKYNYNQVIKTQCGHIIELDDSSGDERIHVYHTTGTYMLIDHNGDIWVNGVRDATYTIARDVKWEIGRDLSVHVGRNADYVIDGNRTEHVKGTSDYTIDGDRTETDNSNSTFTIQGNRTETVMQDSTYTTQGNRSETVQGNSTFNTQGNRLETIGGSSTISIGGSLVETIGGGGTFDTTNVAFTNTITVATTGTAGVDFIGGGISLVGHVHGGVMGGPSVTSPPM